MSRLFFYALNLILNLKSGIIIYVVQKGILEMKKAVSSKKERDIQGCIRMIQYYSKVYSPKCSKAVYYKKKLERLLNS